VSFIFGKKSLYSNKYLSMPKTEHKNIAQSFAADVNLLQKKIGHLDQNEIARIQLEYVKYVTD
jgi:hypothetical protein